MASYYEDDYEEEEEEMNQYEKLGLEWPGGPFMAPVKWRVEGILTGDVKWNNINAKIQMYIPYPESERASLEEHIQRYGRNANLYKKIFSVNVRPFTHNCGIKTIEDLALKGSIQKCKLFITYLESFLWHKCNCGIIIGSDYIDKQEEGDTGRIIKRYGIGYIIEEPTWNPNYTWLGGKTHNIFLFHKQLGANVPVDYWG